MKKCPKCGRRMWICRTLKSPNYSYKRYWCKECKMPYYFNYEPGGYLDSRNTSGGK